MTGETSSLPETMFYGSSRLGNRQLFYKLVGYGTQELYNMALELTDFSSALIATFSLQEVHKCQLRSAAPTPERLEELLCWLHSIQHSVAASENGEGVSLTICHPIELEPGESTIVEIRLPPKGSLAHTLHNIDVEWVNSDIMMSLLNVYNSCQSYLKEQGLQICGHDQVSRIANFIEQVNYNSDQKALNIVNSPPKHRRTPGPEIDVSVKEGRDLGGKSGATEPENTEGALVQKIGEGFIAPEESRQDTGDAKQVNAVPTPKRPGKGLKKHNPAGMRVGRKLKDAA